MTLQVFGNESGPPDLQLRAADAQRSANRHRRDA
jgi:hypothetical protein